MLISVEFCIDIGTFGLVFMSQRQRQNCKLLNVFLMNSVYFVPCIDSKYDIPQASSTISWETRQTRYQIIQPKKNQSTTLICAIS